MSKYTLGTSNYETQGLLNEIKRIGENATEFAIHGWFLDSGQSKRVLTTIKDEMPNLEKLDLHGMIWSDGITAQELSEQLGVFRGSRITDFVPPEQPNMIPLTPIEKLGLMATFEENKHRMSPTFGCEPGATAPPRLEDEEENEHLPGSSPGM